VDLILSAPEHWDLISRGQQLSKTVSVLVLDDGLDLLAQPRGHVIEAVD
jgi:replicative superfamily II helicase